MMNHRETVESQQIPITHFDSSLPATGFKGRAETEIVRYVGSHLDACWEFVSVRP
jgi:hypothetical protein